MYHIFVAFVLWIIICTNDTSLSHSLPSIHPSLPPSCFSYLPSFLIIYWTGTIQKIFGRNHNKQQVDRILAREEIRAERHRERNSSRRGSDDEL